MFLPTTQYNLIICYTKITKSYYKLFIQFVITTLFVYFNRKETPMKQQLKKLTAISLSIFLLLSMITVFSNSKSYGATQYVTLDGNPGALNGGITIYKDAGCNTPWTYTDSSGVVYTAIMGKSIYMPYVNTVGSYSYQIEFGDLKGYVKKLKTKVTSLPSNATKLSNRKKVVVGVWGKNYVPYRSYVVYKNEGIGQIEWASYCNDPNDFGNRDAWVIFPYAHAYLKPLT